ncbi:hypothetical protein TWF696_006937 [Orbilia brochopaga]|uniref:Uncharacterized protein n=1 Tax=Orbilia brochopaga TaxID=3140254 RepID=A0AAV9USU5_9PEZI
MTPEICQAICKNNGYRYAGLEYYYECYCGSALPSQTYEESQNVCTLPCNGDPDKICGGKKGLSIYRDENYPAPSPYPVAGYIPFGCHRDAYQDVGRILTEKQNLPGSTMTPQLCLTTCGDGGYPFAGVEYGSECWCGSKLTYPPPSPSDTPKCETRCKGDSSLTCGGNAAIEIYYNNNLDTMQVCGLIPDTSCNNIGINFEVYSHDFPNDSPGYGYTKFDVEYFNTKAQNQEFEGNGVTSALGPIYVSTEGAPITIYDYNRGNGDFFAVLHTGYLFAPVDGTYIFIFTNVDDIAYLWFGDNSLDDNWTHDNANLRQTLINWHYPTAAPDIPERFTTPPLTAGNYYHFRVLLGNGQGISTFTARIVGPNGQEINPKPYFVTQVCESSK